MPKRGEILEILESLRAALAWNIAPAEAAIAEVSVRVRMYVDGRPWSVQLRIGESVTDLDQSGQHVEPTGAPCWSASTLVRCEDSDQLLLALAQSLLEDLSVQIETAAPEGGTTMFQPDAIAEF
jgi:hypothetical protein